MRLAAARARPARRLRARRLLQQQIDCATPRLPQRIGQLAAHLYHRRRLSGQRALLHLGQFLGHWLQSLQNATCGIRSLHGGASLCFAAKGIAMGHFGGPSSRHLGQGKGQG